MLRILAIDNEPSVITSLRFAFGPPRYHLSTLTQSEDVFAEIDEAAESFDVLIVDQKMPNLTGAELVRAMRWRGLTTPVIVLSAHISDDIRQLYEDLEVEAIFEKPFDLARLRAAVDAAGQQKTSPGVSR